MSRSNELLTNEVLIKYFQIALASPRCKYRAYRTSDKLFAGQVLELTN